MGLAETIAKRTTCVRLGVGCVIATPDFRKILSWGYNGNVTGGPNSCDRTGEAAVGNCGCIHAETNAIVKCDAPPYVDKVVFCTYLPCVACSKLIIQLGGVKEVYYRNDYRIKESLVWLYNAGIVAGHFETDDMTPIDALLKAQNALGVLRASLTP
jgi:dCMP deaminase